MSPLKFIPVAQAVAGLSKDGSTKVGAIILDEDCNILSVGFNGFPRGVKDTPDRYADKVVKYQLIAHAESNAIAQAARTGARLLGSCLLVTALYPCSMCARLIIQSGIKTVYAPKHGDEINPKWIAEAIISRQMFAEAGVKVIEYEEVQ